MNTTHTPPDLFDRLASLCKPESTPLQEYLTPGQVIARLKELLDHSHKLQDKLQKDDTL